MGKYYIPNILLPIYSVDMMLKYLRKSYNFDEIVNESKLTKKEDLAPKNLIEMENEVRDIANISIYYRKLIELTKTELNKIDDKDSNRKNGEGNNIIIDEFYENIYNEGVDIFLTEAAKIKKPSSISANIG